MRRKWPWRRIFIVAGIAFGLYLAIGVILAGRGTPPLPPTISAIDLHGGHVQGNRITTRSWSFDYRSAQLSADGSIGTVTGVRDGIVFRKGKPYVKIFAESISINTDTLDFTALGKVTVVRIGDPQHRSFDTDLVQWDNPSQLLTMTHPSYLRTGDQTLKIASVVVDFRTKNVTLGKLEGAVEVPK